MRYYVDDYDGDFENSYKVKTTWDSKFLSSVAEDAAEDYHSNHDGWECEWPLTFVILDDEGKELGRFEVDREAVPEFHASPIKEKKAGGGAPE